jgi:hypothetical protein
MQAASAKTVPGDQQHFGKGVDQVLVVISDRSHAKDLAIEEFDSFFVPENAGLRHPVILVDRKLPGRGFEGFGEKGLHKCFQWCGRGWPESRAKYGRDARATLCFNAR